MTTIDHLKLLIFVATAALFSTSGLASDNVIFLSSRVQAKELAPTESLYANIPVCEKTLIFPRDHIIEIGDARRELSDLRLTQKNLKKYRKKIDDLITNYIVTAPKNAQFAELSIELLYHQLWYENGNKKSALSAIQRYKIELLALDYAIENPTNEQSEQIVLEGFNDFISWNPDGIRSKNEWRSKWLEAWTNLKRELDLEDPTNETPLLLGEIHDTLISNRFQRLLKAVSHDSENKKIGPSHRRRAKIWLDQAASLMKTIYL